jgi:serine protease AprX
VPCVISVGGIDDEGNPEIGRIMAYRSSYGPTIDGVQKPEIVTLADWIPAPILPETPTSKQARLLRRLELAKDDELSQIIAENRGVFPALDEAKDRQPYLLRQIVNAGLHDEKVIDEHYKMVDGTSFSAPSVSSVVAQMLEANPALTPSLVKRILIRTARRIPDIEVDRQGWGTLQPKAAVEAALALRAR